MKMTTEPIDLYDTLGLARDATQAQISAAYRTLLRRYHPDTRAPTGTSGDAASDAALQHVLLAYTVLRDPTRRLAYDQETAPRTAPSTAGQRHSHLSWIRAVEDPPLRVGPVHWTPWATATSRGTRR
jgi:DnaJ-class molecular chaperone